MSAVGSRAGEAPRRPRSAPAATASVRSTTVGHVADRQVAGPHLDDLLALAAYDDRDAGHGVVAVAPGDLLERDAPARRQRREERRHGDLVVAQRGLQRPDEEVGGGDRAPARRDPRRRPSRRAASARTGISAAGSAWTIEPTVVPRLRIVGWATCAQRQRAAAAGRGAPRRGERRRRAGRAHRPGRRRPSTARRSRPGIAVDVDEQRRCREPHRQQRDQALAAGEHLRVRVRRQDLHGFGEGGRAGGTSNGAGFTVRSSTSLVVHCVWRRCPVSCRAAARPGGRRR